MTARPGAGGRVSGVLKPYYERAGIVIYHGRAESVLPSLEPGTVDLLLTDPPYGLGFDYGTDFKDPSAGYIEWLWPLIEQAEQLVRPGGYVVVYQTAKRARDWARWFPRDWRLIALPKCFVQIRPVDLQWATDYALCWRVDAAPRKLAELKTIRSWQPSPARDWYVANNGAWNAQAGDHPCPRPLEQVAYLINCLCPPGGLVLDPFLGSGSSAVAGRTLGRRVIGVEIEERFCALAARRLAQAPLDFGTEPAATQDQMFTEVGA